MEDQGKRILLFVVLAGLIFFAWTWLFPAEPPKPKPPAGDVAGATAAPPTPTSPAGRPRDGAEPPVATEAPEEELVLESAAVRVVFSNLGGVVKDWVILHDPVKGRVLNEHLVLAGQPGKGLGAVNFVNSTHVLPVAAAWKGEKLSDRKVRYRYQDAALDIVKEFELFPDDFVMKMTVEVGAPSGASGPAAAQKLAVSVFGHTPSGELARRTRIPTGTSCHFNGTVTNVRSAALARGPRERHGTVRYVGLAHRYDLVAISPRDGRTEGLACNEYRLDGLAEGVQVDLVYPESTLKAGDPPMRRELTVYAGPRYLEKLEHADRIGGHETGFRDVLDFGWFSFIAKPLLWLLTWFYGLVGNWGVAIILLTIVVKLATLYWTTKSMRSMRAMAALKPEIEAIQKRYPDDKAKQQQAQMALFKQHGVSPLAGCLPMLLQMPIWFALYKMLSVAGELHGAIFIGGWLDDLTARDPFYILPVCLTGLMFLQSKVQPMTGDSMQQKILTYGLPLMFGFMGLYFPSGLGVYMLTNTVLSIGHTLYMKREAPTAAGRAAAAAGKGKDDAGKGDAGKGDASKGDASKGDATSARAVSVSAEDAGARGADVDADEADEADEAPAPARGQAARTPGPGQPRRGKRRGKKK